MRVRQIGLLIAVFALAMLSGCKAHEHVYGNWVVTTAASCTSDGTATRTCECGEAETKAITKLPHSYGKWVTTREATCTAEGAQTRSCSCGKLETIATNKLSHSYSEWTTTKAATCSAEGIQTRTCSCGKVETKSIAKTAHNWKDATCAKPKTCTSCGATEGSPRTHGFPNSEFKCTVCGQDVSTSDYKYLAGLHFRSIRNDYSHAVASYATMILYRDSTGDVCILTRVYYTIGSAKFDDLFLDNFTDNQSIEDPEAYYEKLKDRAYGATKIMYMQILQDITEMQLHMLKNEYTYTVSSDYLNM
jgi:hypothetical protein